MQLKEGGSDRATAMGCSGRRLPQRPELKLGWLGWLGWLLGWAGWPGWSGPCVLARVVLAFVWALAGCVGGWLDHR